MTIQINAAARLLATNEGEDFNFEVDAAVEIKDGEGFTAQERKAILSKVEALGKDVAKKASPSFWHNSDLGDALAKYQKLVIAARQLYKEVTIATDMEEIRNALIVFSKLASFDAGLRNETAKLVEETRG